MHNHSNIDYNELTSIYDIQIKDLFKQEKLIPVYSQKIII